MIDKSTFIVRLSLMLILCMCLPVFANGVLGPNLVQNPGFEQESSLWTIQLAKVVSSQAYEGNNSLQYRNTNPKSYRMQTQEISAVPGQTIHFSAWIKGQDIIHSDQRYGASIFMQSYDAQGKYLGGSFPAGPVGTFDWTQIKGFYIVPTGATKVMIGVYLRRGAIGTAWFDSVSAQIEEQSPLAVKLIYPNYHGLTTSDQKNTWKVLLTKVLFPESKPVQVISRLQSPSGEIIAAETRKITSDEESQEFSWEPHSNLVLGQYQWHFEMRSLEEKKIEQQTLSINVRANMPRVYIDNNGFTVVEGHRHFPLGIFTGASRDGKESYNTNTDLELIANAGFNTVLSYSYGTNENAVSFLDDAEKENLHVVYSLKDVYGVQSDSVVEKHLKEVKGHPALLAWYTNDEFGPDRIPELEARYQMIVKKDDTNHPVFQVLYQVNQLSGYLDSLDIVGSDPYPITDKPIREVSEWTIKTVSAANAETHKSIWQVLQLHDKTLRDPQNPMRPPTLDEMRNMSYQALINGTKGLMYYAYHWLWAEDPGRQRNEATFEKRWPDVQKLIHEIKPLTDVILNNDKVDLKVLSPSTAQHQAWQDDNKLYITVVNSADYEEAADLNLEIPAGWRLGPDSSQLKGIDATLKGGTLQIKLAPIASGTIILSRK